MIAVGDCGLKAEVQEKIIRVLKQRSQLILGEKKPDSGGARVGFRKLLLDFRGEET